MPQCEYVKQDGERCRAHAMRGCTLCLSHNPAATELKRAAVAKGGRNRRAPERAETPARLVRVATIEHVQDLLFRTLEELRNGVLDADVARTVGYLAGVTAKVFETVELGRRVTELEETFVQYSVRVEG